MSRQAIRIVIADDHALMREGLRTMLEGARGIALVAEAKDGAEAVRLVAAQAPAVVLMDITMPVLDGIEATRRIVAATPGVRVVGLTMHTDEALVTEMLRAGAAAVIPKDSGLAAVVKAIRAAAAKRTGPAAPAACPDLPAHLTARECEVLVMMARGLCTKEIGWALKISPKTVETHRAHLMDKTGIRTVAGLTRYALDHGIVPA